MSGLTAGLSTGVDARPAGEESTAVSEIVVRANAGPALWRVTKGPSELVILGSITPTLQNGAWDTRRVAEALRGARVLMLSPESTPGFAWAENFRDSQRYLLAQPLGHTLDKELGADAGGRFDRMAVAIGRPLSVYSTYRPAPAGMRLLEDSWRARGLTGSKLDDEVIGLARAAHVRVFKVDEGGALPLIDAMPGMTKGQQAACAAQAMDQFDWQGANAGLAFRAWAIGDLVTLRDTYKPLSLCLDSIPGGSARRDRAHATWFKALGDALETPGRTVVMADVSDLFKSSDLLDFLRARGATVTSPRGEPAPGSPSLRLASGVSVETAEPLDLADATPERLELAPPRTATVEVSKVPGRTVDLADGDRTCVTEVLIGTMLPHTRCLTRTEWREIEEQREVEKAVRRNSHQSVKTTSKDVQQGSAQ